jgi:hypothetical protein
VTRDHPGQLWLFEDGSMRRVIVCGPRPDPDELGAVLLERAVAVAHKLALPAEQREEIAAEVIVRALPWAQRWRGGGRRRCGRTWEAAVGKR